jgi:hypothetical protein
MRPAWPLRAFALSLLAVGCGLISSDISKLSFDLPTKMYSFDTQMWNLPMGGFPAVPCGAGQLVMDCCAPPAPLPQPNCAMTPLACDEGLCALHQPVTVVQKMNLGQEVPQLRSLSGQRLVNVSISQIRYTVNSTLNVDMPPVALYLAPDGVSDPNDPQAKRFGTVPTTAAGAMNVAGMVELEPDAEQTFAGYAADFATPFNFIATTTVVVVSGSPVPSGRVDISVTGQVSAKL